jgi:oligopeptide/dipeptide ABC transporter ATP-binding protein
VSLLDVKGLTISYPGTSEPAVDRLDLSIDAGESLGLVGDSGSGKTQTALAIMGLLAAQARVEGQVLFDGETLSGRTQAFLNRFRARRLAMVFQDPQQALNPYLTIGDQLKRVLREHRVVDARAARSRALELLRRVRLPDAARQYRSYPHQLSGGMRQRAMIALALCCEPELLIADEPTTALDVTVQAQVLSLLKDLRARTGIALLLITHDLGVVAENCERMLVIRRGRLLEAGSTRSVFRAPVHPRTRQMLAAAIRLDGAPPEKPPERSGPILEVDRLNVRFRDAPAGWKRRLSRGVVRNLSFVLAPFETLGIVGESGCGKTSLARSIVGLVAADSGSVSLCGERLAARVADRSLADRRRLQMVFQDPVASLSPAMQVGRIIAEPVALHEPHLSREERRDRVASAMSRAGLDHALLERYPHELSGGQAQRVAISRALVLQPKVLICDEAVAALDGTVRRAILELLATEQRRSGLSLVFITHDLAVVRQISHRVLVMYMGEVVELADNETLFTRPRHPYTRALLNAVPHADPERRPEVAPEMVPIEGEVSGERPPGCPFHPRCAYAVARCREEMPLSRRVDGVEVACHRAEELDLR